MVTCVVYLAICAMEAVLPKSGTGGSMGGRLGDFAMEEIFSISDSIGGRLGNYFMIEVVMPKLGTDGSMSGRIGNCWDGSSSAEIGL